MLTMPQSFLIAFMVGAFGSVFGLNEFQLTGSCPASHLLACLPEKNLPANSGFPLEDSGVKA